MMYPLSSGETGCVEVPKRIPLVENLRRQRNECADRLAKLDAAIEALEKSPELGEALNLLSVVC